MSGRSNKDVELDPQEKDLRTALVSAVLNGHHEAVQLSGKGLVEHFKRKKKSGSQVLDYLTEKVPKKYSCYSPLMMSLEDGRIEIAKTLMELGASVAFKNKDGLTALHVACNKGMVEMVRLIMEKGKEQKRFCRKKKTILNSDFEVAINAKERPQGWTPLMYAVYGGHNDVVKELMKSPHLKYDTRNRKKQNVYHVAGRAGRLECFQLLCTPSDDYPWLTQEIINTGCMTKDGKNKNILHQVCCSGKVEIFLWLMENVHRLKTKEELNRKSEVSGYTPLLVACEYQKLEVVELLTKDKDLLELVDLDARSSNHDDETWGGNSALHLAAFHDRYKKSRKMVECLINAGCAVDQVDVNGNTVLHIAHMRLNLSLVKYIETEGKCEGLKSMRNKNNSLPSEVVDEIIIPIEIKKLGEDAEKVYLEALREGKQKIPYCSMLILGEERVGKTSLYRQLVGKDFNKDSIATEGIDNNTVDTVDRRAVDTAEWKEKATTEGEFAEALLREMVDKLPPSKEEQNEGGIREVTEIDLLQEIKDIIQKIIKDRELVVRYPIDHIENPPIPVIHHPIQPHPPSRHPPKRPAPSQVVPVAAKTKRDEVVKPKPVRKQPSQQEPRPKPKTPTETTPPVRKVEPRKESEPVVMLNHKQSTRINSVVKTRTPLKDPSLVLNTLDFAGQKLYRPMHHCFILRRAIYLVVFKIPDMLKSHEESLEEIRYWIHSIHAHIYPPDEEMKGADKRINRVLLVGTHRGEHTEDDLKKINKCIKDVLGGDERCINHIYAVGPPIPRFLPVENSIDHNHGREDTYLHDSGTANVQSIVKAISEKLPFLKEDYPIKWLKFEERLKKKMGTTPVVTTPVVTIDAVRALARRSDITLEDQQDLALKFFHDTGKIIYIRRLPHLFLKDEEQKGLIDNLVILDPHWLISVMRVIMKLNTEKDTDFETKPIQRLMNEGVATMDLFEFCWKEYISTDVKIIHLILMLQCYCLIFPLQRAVEDTSSSCKNQEEYVIPCKLPDTFSDIKIPENRCVVFYFDFYRKFLPDEVYHRLMCLASTRSKPRPRKYNKYSNQCCVFHSLYDTDWVIEMERKKQRLKFAVLPAKKNGRDYISFIHKEFLSKICQESGLEGLAYRGGPEAVCGICGVTGVLQCVSYEDGKSSDMECIGCCPGYDYDLDKLMRPSAEETTISTPISIPKQLLVSDPTLGDLIIKISLADGQDMHVSQGVGTNYIELCILLLEDKNADIATALEKEHGKNAENINRDIFRRWIAGGGKRPVSWDTLIEVLEDMSLTALADKVKLHIKKNSSAS